MAPTTTPPNGTSPLESTQILQWNCNGVRAHQDELRNYLSTPGINIDIVCLEETFLKPGVDFNLRGYIVIREDRTDDQKGGLLIAVKDDLSYAKINNINAVGVETQGVQVKTKNGNINIINGYMRPNKPAAKDELEKLFRKDTTVITGDFNAKSAMWGSTDVNDAGIIVEDLLDKYDYVIANTGQPTRQNYNGGMSHLDITLVSRNLGAKSCWRVLNNCMGSDHLPTVTVIGEAPDVEENWRPKFKLHTADWDEFKKQCSKYVINELLTDNLADSARNVSTQSSGC